MLSKSEQFFEQIKKSQNIIILCNNYFLDSLASGLGLFLLLKKLNKNVEIAVEKNKNIKTIDFLPSFNDIKNNLDDLRNFIVSIKTDKLEISKIKYQKEDNFLNFIIALQKGVLKKEDIVLKTGQFKYDLVITLSCPDLNCLGSLYNQTNDFFYETALVNIDNNPSNEKYGQLNLIDLKASSSSEILFDFFSEKNFDLIDENIATCFLTGIISSTKNFKIGNISPETLLKSSRLINLKARHEEITNFLYRNYDLFVLKFWGLVLSNLLDSLDGKLVWSILKNQEEILDNINLIKFFEEMITSMPKVELAMFFDDKEKQKKVFIYSVKNLDCLDLFKEYKPQGQNNFCQIILDKDIEQFIEETEKKLKKIFL
jgi:nanoRNase/pAp phosphatase (c-di-AMP/oligoRNAs hydrolase)